MSLFAELKRRKVFRVAVVYAATAFVVLQAADILLPALGVPGWAMGLIVTLLGLGFPVALVLGWALELTPDGVRVTLPQLATATEQPAPSILGRRTVAVAALLVAVGIGLGAGWVLRPGAAADVAGAGVAVAGAVGRSIAVLPFVSMSGDEENEYFADGITEEIINLLAQVGELRVAGRTSSFMFKGRSEDLRRIGEELGVTHILEGSVRRSGDRVRITAQLVQAEDGFHLWSDTWDRELTDIFAVQDEIGRAILASLRIALRTGTPEPWIATTDVEAYSLYLRAKTLLARRGADNLFAARTEFEAALALDPDYIPAVVGLARTLALLPTYARIGGDRATRMTDRAVRLARRALEADPANAHAHAVLGTVYTFHQWRWDEAREAFAQALALAPNDPEIANFAGDFYRVVRDPRAVEMEQRAIELDPLHAVNHWDLGWTYVALGDHEQAIDAALAAQALSPGSIDPYGILVWSYGRLGRLAEMRDAQAAGRRNTREAEAEYLMLDVWAALAEGDREAALDAQMALEGHARAGEFSPGYLGFQYLLLGDSRRAAEWLERAYRDRDVQLVFEEPLELWRIGADPEARAVLEHPELSALVTIRARNARTAGEAP
jgi:adenylate cyclase